MFTSSMKMLKTEMTYKGLYEQGVAALKDAGVPDAELDARLMLEYVCHTDRNTLYAHGDTPVSEVMCEMFDRLTERRALRIPLQHLLGTQEFMGLTFVVDENVLIPRQDTECLVEEALIDTADGDRVLDLCTGSGCILLSIMNYKNDIEGVGTDISPAALKVAKLNAERLGADRAGASWNGKLPVFVESDLFGQLSDRLSMLGTQASDTHTSSVLGAPPQFDLIVSNPPYIRTDVIETLEPEVKDHEPRCALDGGADGLVFYRRIIVDAPAFLRQGGRLMLEIGYDQGEAVSSLMEASGFSEVKVVKDFAGNDRVVKAKYR